MNETAPSPKSNIFRPWWPHCIIVHTVKGKGIMLSWPMTAYRNFYTGGKYLSSKIALSIIFRPWNLPCYSYFSMTKLEVKEGQHTISASCLSLFKAAFLIQPIHFLWNSPPVARYKTLCTKFYQRPYVYFIHPFSSTMSSSLSWCTTDS